MDRTSSGTVKKRRKIDPKGPAGNDAEDESPILKLNHYCIRNILQYLPIKDAVHFCVVGQRVYDEVIAFPYKKDSSVYLDKSDEQKKPWMFALLSKNARELSLETVSEDRLKHIVTSFPDVESLVLKDVIIKGTFCRESWPQKLVCFTEGFGSTKWRIKERCDTDSKSVEEIAPINQEFLADFFTHMSPTLKEVALGPNTSVVLSALKPLTGLNVFRSWTDVDAECMDLLCRNAATLEHITLMGKEYDPHKPPRRDDNQFDDDDNDDNSVECDDDDWDMMWDNYVDYDNVLPKMKSFDITGALFARFFDPLNAEEYSGRYGWSDQEISDNDHKYPSLREVHIHGNHVGYLPQLPATLKILRLTFSNTIPAYSFVSYFEALNGLEELHLNGSDWGAESPIPDLTRLINLKKLAVMKKSFVEGEILKTLSEQVPHLTELIINHKLPQDTMDQLQAFLLVKERKLRVTIVNDQGSVMEAVSLG